MGIWFLIRGHLIFAIILLVFLWDESTLVYERPFFLLQMFVFFGVLMIYTVKDLFSIISINSEKIVNEASPMVESVAQHFKEGYIPDNSVEHTKLFLECKPQIKVDVRTIIIREIIEKQLFLDANLTIGKLSEVTELSIYELRSFFSQTQEGSYNAYINRIRIEYSLIILADIKEENKTIDQWAIECGFNSRVSFYRSFKKIMGFAPSELLN